MGRIIGLSATIVDYTLTGMYSAPFAVLGYVLYVFGVVTLISSK